MDLVQIRGKKRRLEQDILQSIKAFEEETTVLIEKVNVFQAVGTTDAPEKRTCDVEVSIIIF